MKTWEAWKDSNGRLNIAGSITPGRDRADICLSVDTPEHARLIAAAPDLLQALEAILARVNGEWDNPSLVKYGALCQNQDDDITGMVKEAIAKAKGE